ncbi:hypothetical protein KL938_004262 [Ogataea parapolymorpha]|nr:hypothetical protein KL938_004262 [Ogataea parapolymorpha]
MASSSHSYSLVGTANVAASSASGSHSSVHSSSHSSSRASSSSSAGAAALSNPISYSGSNSKLVALFAGLVTLGAVVSAL